MCIYIEVSGESESPTKLPCIWKSGPTNCRRSVVSSGYSGFLHQKTAISSSFRRLAMTLAVAEALNPNKPNLQIVGEKICSETRQRNWPDLGWHVDGENLAEN